MTFVFLWLFHGKKDYFPSKLPKSSTLLFSYFCVRYAVKTIAS